MKREGLFAEKVKQEAGGLKLNLLEVDGSTSLQQNFEFINEFFSL